MRRPVSTGPLAQQIAQVWEGLDDGCAYACGCNDPGNPQRCIHAERFAALSVIERHVQDMTEALEPFAAITCFHTILAGADEKANAEALAEKREACPYCRVRAALPAREGIIE